MDKKVGILKDEYLKYLDIILEDHSIYAHSGTFKHIKKRHPDIEDAEEKIKAVLSSPDYIGTHPKETNSIEYIKLIEKNYLVAVKFDVRDNRLIVATLYGITEAKLKKHLETNRITSV